MSLIEMKDVKKNYLDLTFNFQVNKNEKIIIKGENGSGKSTLIKLLIGYIKPDKGVIIKKNLKLVI